MIYSNTMYSNMIFLCLFHSRWNFERALGAIDGKHIHIQNPGEGSLFFNYKKYFSVILLALVDADYRFMFIDVGAEGSCSDAGIFRECGLMNVINNFVTIKKLSNTVQFRF